MMVSPQYYRSTIENYSLEELRKVRDELLEEIRQFENNEIPEDEFYCSPSPIVKYQCNNDYLVEVIQLINQKYNESLWDDEDDSED